jgi:phosphatidylserine/phosphatidylglycerophosphate/cardiolipin synthase-like enzyme
VRVRIILPAPSGPDPDAAAVAAVTRAGAQVHWLPASYLYAHAKAIMVDGQRAFVGSENLSAASLDRNRELGVIVADQRAIATLQATFAADWRHQ